MMRRFRTIGAIVSLLAFPAFLAEGVWAAMCPPDMDSEMSHVSAMAGDSHADMPMHAPAPSEGQPAGHDGDTMPACPLAIGSAGCTSLSLVGAGASIAFGAVETAIGSAVPYTHPDLLVVTALFHPPRA
jgi:hypothetical protein